MKHKCLTIFIVSIMLFFGINLATHAQDEQAQDRGADKTHHTLKNLPGVMLKTLNFTKEEAAQTTRGEKLKVFFLGLDKLKAFQSGDNTKKLLIDTKEIVYPLYVGKVLKNALSIRKRNGGWKTASIGSKEIHFLEPVRMRHSQKNNIKVKSYYIVRVPAIYLRLLGYDQGGKMYLVPTHEVPDVKLDIGKSVPANDLYLKIKPLAAKYENILIPPKKKK